MGSAFETAVTITKGGSGRTLGARYTFFDILPHAEPEQPDPATLHSKAFSLVPVTRSGDHLRQPERSNRRA